MSDLAEQLRNRLAAAPFQPDHVRRSDAVAALTAVVDRHQPHEALIPCGHHLPDGTPGHYPHTTDTVLDEDGHWLCSDGNTVVCTACCVDLDGTYLSPTCEAEHQPVGDGCWPCREVVVIADALGIEVTT